MQGAVFVCIRSIFHAVAMSLETDSQSVLLRADMSGRCLRESAAVSLMNTAICLEVTLLILWLEATVFVVLLTVVYGYL